MMERSICIREKGECEILEMRFKRGDTEQIRRFADEFRALADSAMALREPLVAVFLWGHMVEMGASFAFRISDEKAPADSVTVGQSGIQSPYEVLDANAYFYGNEVEFEVKLLHTATNEKSTADLRCRVDGICAAAYELAGLIDAENGKSS